MFNVGGPEIVVILLIALIVLGPDQLPKAMRTFGNVMAEIRKVSGGFQAEMRKAMDTIETSGSDSRSEAPAPDGVHRPPRDPSEADVTEVVARNPPEDPDVATTVAADAPSAEGADTPDDPAGPSPADRASG